MWMSVTASPRLASPHAASTPSRPPPITTARDPGRACCSDVDIIEIAEGDEHQAARAPVLAGGWLSSPSPAPGGRSRAAYRWRAPPPAAPDAEPDASTPPSRLHALLAVPGGRPQLDIRVLRLAGQQARQQHAVVGRMRLLGRHHDVVAARALLDEFLDQLEGRHPAANDHQPLGSSPLQAHRNHGLPPIAVCHPGIARQRNIRDPGAECARDRSVVLGPGSRADILGRDDKHVRNHRPTPPLAGPAPCGAHTGTRSRAGGTGCRSGRPPARAACADAASARPAPRRCGRPGRWSS